MLLTLYRIRENQWGTFGVICDEKKVITPTLERPWKNNEPEVSCIPLGKYKCVRNKSPHFGEGFKILDVPNRTDVLFHAGNWQYDSKGCIIIGLSFEIKNNQEALGWGGLGMQRFMKAMEGVNEFDLEIKDLSV